MKNPESQIPDRHVSKSDIVLFHSKPDDYTKKIRERIADHLKTCEQCTSLNRTVLKELLQAKTATGTELNRYYR